MSSQEKHPWKTIVRTVLQAVIGLLVILPQVVEAADLSESIPWVAGGLAVSAAVTRVMALPSVEKWLRRFVPWLAADLDDIFLSEEGASQDG